MWQLKLKTCAEKSLKQYGRIHLMVISKPSDLCFEHVLSLNSQTAYLHATDFNVNLIVAILDHRYC